MTHDGQDNLIQYFEWWDGAWHFVEGESQFV